MDIVTRILNSAPSRSILEVGPGLGGAAWHLATGREYRGYEPDPIAFEIAEKRLAPLPGAVLCNSVLPPEPDRLFDAVVAFEVLEHIEDDAGALQSWQRWLEPHGVLVLSVPAKQSRYGPYDERVGHYRRYDRDTLFELLESVGFSTVDIRSYGMPLGYLMEYVRNRFLARRLVPEEEMSVRSARSGRSFQPRSNAIVLKTLLWPFRHLQRPFETTNLGIGYVAAGRSPE